MGNELNDIRLVYDGLWDEAIPAFERNEFQLDPHLRGKAGDARRSVTLALRLSPGVQSSITSFLHELSAVAPAQYFYRPEEFHVTVLALIPGSERWREKMKHVAAFKTISGEVVRRHRKFSVRFQGVTASRGAVLIQGFPSDDTLLDIRNDLRETLGRNQLGEGLDVRYKIKSAHVTVMRFCEPRANGNQLVALLRANRAKPFGEVPVENLELLFGDWYASTQVTRTLQKFALID